MNRHWLPFLALHPATSWFCMAGLARLSLALGLSLTLAMVCSAAAHAEEDQIDLDLEAPVDVPLSHDSKYDRTQSSAAKYEQKQNEVAASVSVITRDEIKAFGWRTLDQALARLIPPAPPHPGAAAVAARAASSAGMMTVRRADVSPRACAHHLSGGEA